MATIGKLAVQITADTTGLNQGLNSAEKTVSAFSDRMDGLASSLKTIAPLAVAAGAAFAFNMARALADSADRLDELSQRIGVSVEDLTRLQWAAQMSGASAETLTMALQKLSLNMANSKDPASESAAAFKALGVDVTNTDGTMRSQLDVLNDMADALSGFKDGANKTAIVVQLLGRSGAELIPMMNGGSQSIKALAAESDKLGNTLSTNTSKAAAEFNDHLDRMAARASSVAKAIATPLLANLNALFSALERGVDRASLAGLAGDVVKLSNDLKALQDRTSNPFVNQETLSKNIEETKAKLEVAKKAFKEADAAFTISLNPPAEPPKPTREAPSIAKIKPEEMKDPLGDFADKKVEEQAQRFAREEKMRDEMLQRNAEALKLASLSELDQEQFKYEEKLRLLEEYLMREPEMMAEYMGVKEQMATDHEARMVAIRKKGLTDLERWNALSYKDQAKTVASELMNMTGAAATENRKMFEINKAASLANAVIKGYESAVNAYAFGSRIGGPPVGAAMAALSIAATGAQINAIRSQSFGGGGGGTAYAPSGSTAATGQTAMQGIQGGGSTGVGQVITIQGVGANDMFSGESVRGLIDQLIEAQRNGSKVVLS
jgi:hypothetical protein